MLVYFNIKGKLLFCAGQYKVFYKIIFLLAVILMNILNFQSLVCHFRVRNTYLKILISFHYSKKKLWALVRPIF